MGEFKLELQSGNAQFRSKSMIFVPCGLDNWRMTLKNNRALLLYYGRLWASFQRHRWIQTWITVRKRSIQVKIDDFLVPCDLEIWRMTLKNNRAPLLSNIKLYAISPSSYVNSNWSYGQGAVSIRKTVLPGRAIPMLKIRRPNGRLIFNMEIAIRR